MLAYLRLQLLMKRRTYNPQNYRRVNQSKLRAVISYIGFTVLALYLVGLMVWFELLLFDQLAAIGQPDIVLAVCYLVSTFLTLIYGFFTIAAQLFFNRETSMISTLPIGSRSVLAVKTIMVVLSEAGVSLVLCAPLIIRLGIYHSAGLGFYLRAFLGCLFVPVLPLTVALLLSFLLIRLSRLWKRREAVTTIFSFALMIGVMLISMGGQSMNQANLTAMLMSLIMGQQSLTNILLANYPPLQWLCNGVQSGGLAGWGQVLSFIVISIGVLGLMVYLLGKGYLVLAVRQEEALHQANTKAHKKLGRERSRSALTALFRQEVREVITVPTYATNCLTGIVMFPTMMIIMWISMRSNMPSANLALELAGLIPKDFFLAGAIGWMCMVNIMGIAVSTAVSREGSRHELRKTYPISGSTHLLAKLLMGMLLNLVTSITSLIVLIVLLPMFWGETLLALVIGQIFGFLWCALSLMVDVRWPKLQWKTEVEAVKQNFNGVLSMLLGLGIIALMAGVTVLCVAFLDTTVIVGLAAAVSLLIIGAVVAGWILIRKTSAAYFLR